eukprot:COSAG05_NODE_824_length_7108_cov_616.375375_5_plen_862_part_00
MSRELHVSLFATLAVGGGWAPRGAIAAAVVRARAMLTTTLGLLLAYCCSPHVVLATPAVFWHSEGNGANTTVLALGGGLLGATIELCGAAAGSSDPSSCSNATMVLDAWDGAVKFRLPAAGTGPGATPHTFRACARGTCSDWRSLNAPALWWAQGDASTNGTAIATTGSAGWLKVYGRSLGFDVAGACTASTRAVVSPATSTKAVLFRVGDSQHCELETRAASCYDATFGLPACAKPGTYTLQLQAMGGPWAGYLDTSFGGGAATVTLLRPRPWPSKRFVVAAGGNISVALDAANTAGGGVVALAPGVFEMGSVSLALGDGVQLVGASSGSSVLHWGEATTQPLVANRHTKQPGGSRGGGGGQQRLEVSHFACDNGATWSYDNATQQIRFNREHSGLKCLTAQLPPTSGSALFLDTCTNTTQSVSQQWTWIDSSLRLAVDTSYGGGASLKSGAGGFLLWKCNAEPGTCDTVLQGWHRTPACFGPNPSACWLDVPSKGRSPGGCPPNLQLQSQISSDDTHCCVGNKSPPPPPPLGRFLLAQLTIIVGAPNGAAVVDIGGHGVVVRGLNVRMKHSLSGSTSVFRTHGTAFEITGCNATHDNAMCKSPGYPNDCLLFFESGTDGGLVAHNSFHMGCCAFAGYAASGVLLEDNNFTDLANGAFVDGNGFTSFGGKRVAERISFSRNLYQGLLHNSSETRMANEAFTSDGTGAAYYGYINTSIGTQLVVGSRANPGWIGAAVAVLEGFGQGQVRRVVAASGNTYTIDRPWSVSLGASSLISVNPYVGKVLMQGNTIRNATTIQIFGSGFDSVYAGNMLQHMYSTKVVHPGGMMVFGELLLCCTCKKIDTYNIMLHLIMYYTNKTYH